MSAKTDKLVKQFTNMSAAEFREFQAEMERRGFLVGLSIVPDSWLRDYAPKADEAQPPAPSDRWYMIGEYYWVLSSRGWEVRMCIQCDGFTHGVGFSGRLPGAAYAIEDLRQIIHINRPSAPKADETA